MEQIKKDLQFLYPDSVEETLQEIDQIVNHYRAITLQKNLS